jgi:hypothetical protein
MNLIHLVDSMDLIDSMDFMWGGCGEMNEMNVHGFEKKGDAANHGVPCLVLPVLL